MIIYVCATCLMPRGKRKYSFKAKPEIRWNQIESWYLLLLNFDTPALRYCLKSMDGPCRSIGGCPKIGVYIISTPSLLSFRVLQCGTRNDNFAELSDRLHRIYPEIQGNACRYFSPENKVFRGNKYELTFRLELAILYINAGHEDQVEKY